MKQTRRLTIGLVACLAFAMASTLVAQTTEGAAKVIRIKGPARYTTGNNVWSSLKVGTVLRPGTIVQTSTEAGSFVDIAIGGNGNVAVPAPASYTLRIPNSMNLNAANQASTSEQDVIRLFENTALGIDRLSCSQTGAEEVCDVQLDLKAGRIAGTVKKMSAASKYEVKLPNGVAGVRGSGVYDVSADGVLRVLVGSVVLASVDAKSGNVATQVVMGGQQYDARTGQMSPISSAELSGLEKTIAAMRTMGADRQTTQVADKTVIPMSPVGPGVRPE